MTAPSATSPAAGLHGEWPLVGREGERRLLAALLRRRDATGAVLVGPPGAGKTRLAADALARAADAGMPTARVLATRAAAGLPLGALQPLLPEGPPGGGPELLRRAAAALAARAAGVADDRRRLVLLVDSANQLDEASATLVHQLASARGAVVLVTLRPGEPAPAAVTGLWKDRLAERLEVCPLDGDTVADLLARVLGGPVDPAAVARLAARAQGNLLYLRELAISAVESGALADDAGMWRLVAAPGVTPRLAELVGARLADLPPARRALLEAVALGEPVGAAELARLGDPADAEALEAAGLLAGSVDGRRLMLRLAHPLYGEVLRAGTTTLRRRSVARSLADAVDATGARRAGDAVRVAGWRLEAGGAGAEELLRAAESARRAFDFAAAERFARAAVEAGAGFDARVVAAELAGLQGRCDEAEAEFAAIAGGTDRERARAAVARMDNLRFVGRIREAAEVGAAAAATLGSASLRAEVEARRAALLLSLEGPAAAERAAAAVRGGFPDPAGVPGAAVAWACLVSVLALTRLGDAAGAAEAAAAGRAAHAAADPPPRWPDWALDLARADALTAAGDPDAAVTQAGSLHAAALASGALDAQAYAALSLARAALAQGRVDSAARSAREAATLLRSLGRAWLLPAALAILARAEALALRATAADAALAELAALTGPEVPAWTRADVLGAQAWTAVAAGDVPAACKLLAEAADAGAACGDTLGLLAALHDLARLGRPREVADRTAAAAATAGGRLAPAQAAHVAGLVRQDPEALAAAADAFAAAGAWLLAAEARADCAVAWQRAGRPKSAAVAARAAEELAGRCEGASTPALAALDARAVLTPAEREAALLAAAGRSNRDIAATLDLSVRTVENRLQRAYEKLGVSGRADLAAALQR